jgi:hypothetical protein
MVAEPLHIVITASPVLDQHHVLGQCVSVNEKV